MIDCELLAKVYINLIDQKEPTLNFQNLDKNETGIINRNISYFKKVVELSSEEKSKHHQYLKTNLRKNFF